MKKSQFNKETPEFEAIYGRADEIQESYLKNYLHIPYISPDDHASLMENLVFQKAIKFTKQEVPTQLKTIIDNSRLSNGDPKSLFMMTTHFMKEDYITKELLAMIYFAWLDANSLLGEPIYNKMKDNWSIVYSLILEGEVEIKEVPEIYRELATIFRLVLSRLDMMLKMI